MTRSDKDIFQRQKWELKSPLLEKWDLCVPCVDWVRLWQNNPKTWMHFALSNLKKHFSAISFLNECTELLWLNCLGFQLGIKAIRLEASHYLHSQLSFHRMGWTDLKSPLLTERSCFLFSVPCCLLQHVCYSCWAFGSKIILLQQQKANRIFLLFVHLLVCLGFVLLWKGSRTEQQIHQPFQWWEAINEGSCLWGGMNPWSPAGHSCWGVFKRQVLTGSIETYNSQPLTKREKRVSVMWVHWWHFPGLHQKTLPLWLSPMPEFIKNLV